MVIDCVFIVSCCFCELLLWIDFGFGLVGFGLGGLFAAVVIFIWIVGFGVFDFILRVGCVSVVFGFVFRGISLFFGILLTDRG